MTSFALRRLRFPVAAAPVLFLATVGYAQGTTPPANASFVALYMQDNRIGYSYSAESKGVLNGKNLRKVLSATVMDAELMGTTLRMRIDGTTWMGANNAPVRMDYRVSSAGLNQTVVANFGAKAVNVTVNNIGKTTRTTLPLPNGPVVDDPLITMMGTKQPPKPGTRRKVFILDPMTVSFVENTVVYRGPSKITVDGKTVNATLVEIQDPRASTRVYLNSKGELIRATTGMGIEMRPTTRVAALAPVKPGNVPTDLADATRITPDKPIPNPRLTDRLSLRITTTGNIRVPADAGQTVKVLPDGAEVEIHPVRFNETETPLAANPAPDPKWSQPSLHMPSDSAAFRARAKEIIGDATTVEEASRRIHRSIHQRMRANAGMGVLRNADQVWESREGVCRDYAILTTTLARAAGIPSRLVGGMIYADGAFYYHAWTEVWAKDRWVGLDATLPEFELSAAHLKLADGNVDQAYAFSFLENAKIAVRDVVNRR